MFDILFRNAKVIDGTGNPWFYGDVGVEGGTVAAVLPPGSTARARRVADVDGKALCPGFVDGHSHSELPLLAGEGMDCKIMQGVTTENLGLDGMSPPLCDLSPYSGEVRARTGCAVAGRGHPQDDFANRPARSGWRTRASPCPDLTRISWPSTSGPCWTPTAATIPASIPPGCPMFWRTGRLSSETAS